MKALVSKDNKILGQFLLFKLSTIREMHQLYNGCNTINLIIVTKMLKIG